MGQWCHAYPINPKKGSLGSSVIHSMPGAQWRAPNLADSPPTDLRGANLPTAHRLSTLDGETESV